jgi:hypothetical protein
VPPPPPPPHTHTHLTPPHTTTTNQVHTNYYSGGANPDVRDALAAFLIATGPLAFFSGPYGWQIYQTWEDPLGIQDVRQRWLPEFDKALGEAEGLGVLNNTTSVWTRSFASGTRCELHPHAVTPCCTLDAALE